MNLRYFNVYTWLYVLLNLDALGKEYNCLDLEKFDVLLDAKIKPALFPDILVCTILINVIKTFFKLYFSYKVNIEYEY
jgi:hypothetical protein